MNTPSSSSFHSLPSRGVHFVFPKLVMPLWDDNNKEKERREIGIRPKFIVLCAFTNFCLIVANYSFSMRNYLFSVGNYSFFVQVFNIFVHLLFFLFSYSNFVQKYIDLKEIVSHVQPKIM
jgi:hypothetical protein